MKIVVDSDNLFVILGSSDNWKEGLRDMTYFTEALVAFGFALFVASLAFVVVLFAAQAAAAQQAALREEISRRASAQVEA